MRKICNMIYKFKNFLEKLKRVFQYIKIIWKTNDYDYDCTIQLFIFQLKRLADTIEKNDRHQSSKYSASRIKLCIRLLEHGYESRYTSKVFSEYESKYGELKFDFVPCDNAVFGNEQLSEINLTWSNVDSIEQSQSIDKLLDIDLQDAQRKEQKCKKLAWTIIDQQIESWWA